MIESGISSPELECDTRNMFSLLRISVIPLIHLLDLEGQNNELFEWFKFTTYEGIMTHNNTMVQDRNYDIGGECDTQGSCVK